MANSGIRVNLGLNDRLSPSLRRATRDVRRFSQNSSRSFRGVGDSLRSIQRIAGLAFAAFTTGRAARAITDFAKAGDEIAKTARQIGIGVEALQELRFAAERSGVDTNTLTTSLEQMNLRVGQLRNGQGALTTALARTNPMLRQQLRDAQSSEEAFELLIAEIEKQPNAQARAALATAAFGRAGQDLIVMAENGVDGLRALREEARAYGNIMDEEATSASEAFTDSMSNLRATFLSFRNQALTPLIRALQPLIKQFTDFITQNRELITLKVQEYFQHIKNAVEVLVKLWDSGFLPAILAGVVAFKAIIKAVALYQSVMATAKAITIGFSIAMATNPVGMVALAIAGLIGLIVLLVKNWDLVKEKVKEFVTFAIEGMNSVASAIWTFIEPLVNAIANLGAGIRSVIGSVGGFLGNAFGGAIESPTSRNESLIRNESISRSQVDINVGGLPQGSTVRQQGGSPSVTLNYGFATGGF
jgi:hypothetical protein